MEIFNCMYSLAAHERLSRLFVSLAGQTHEKASRVLHKQEEGFIKCNHYFWSDYAAFSENEHKRAFYQDYRPTDVRQDPAFAVKYSHHHAVRGDQRLG